MVSNAIHKYKKSRAGVGSTYTAKLETCGNNLCIQYIPKQSLKQRLLRRWAK